MHRLLITVALLVVGAATLGGCQAKAPGPAALIEPADAQHLGYRLGPATNLDLPAGQALTHAAVVGDLLLLVEEPRNVLTAVSLQDASVRWRTVVGTQAERLHDPIGFEDRILVNSESLLYVLDAATGRLLQHQALSASVRHGPAMFTSLALFGTASGEVIAHDVRTGNNRWRQGVSDSVLASPVVYDTEVFVADTGGRALMLMAATGDVLWSTRTFGPVSAPAWVDRVAVYMACEDGSLYALSRVDGRDRWVDVYRAGVPLRSRPRVVGDVILLSTPGSLLALDVGDGRPRWRFDADATPVAELGQRLLVHHARELLLLDPETGRAARQIPVGDLRMVRLLDNGSILLISPRGRILRLDPDPQGPTS